MFFFLIYPCLPSPPSSQSPALLAWPTTSSPQPSTNYNVENQYHYFNHLTSSFYFSLTHSLSLCLSLPNSLFCSPSLLLTTSFLSSFSLLLPLPSPLSLSTPHPSVLLPLASSKRHTQKATGTNIASAESGQRTSAKK